jgi:carotenoid cleavage dioxygenase
MKRAYALVEADLPFQVKVREVNNLVEVDSLEHDDFDGQLKHACSAHPKVDAKTQEFFVFGYHPQKPIVFYSVFNKDRKMTRSVRFPLASTRMIHDFLVTERFGIIPDLPLEQDPQGAVRNKRFIYNFNAKSVARFGFFPRETSSPDSIVWIESEPLFIFHFANAWDYKNEKGEDIIVFFAVTWASIDISLESRKHWQIKGEFQKFEKFTVNLTQRTLIRTVLVDDGYCEFPNIA